MKTFSFPSSEVEQYDFEDLFVTPEGAEALHQHSSSDGEEDVPDDEFQSLAATATEPVSSLTNDFRTLVRREGTDGQSLITFYLLLFI